VHDIVTNHLFITLYTLTLCSICLGMSCPYDNPLRFVYSEDPLYLERLRERHRSFYEGRLISYLPMSHPWTSISITVWLLYYNKTKQGRVCTKCI